MLMSHNAVLIEKLKDSLKNERESGKHALYQSLPTSLQLALGVVDYQPSSRFEYERLKIILQQVDLKDKTVVDIGCNLGFFSFSALSEGARKIHSIEGNLSHAKFINDAAILLGAEDRLNVINKYFDFNSCDDRYDVGFVLNVLHHVGDDYGSKLLVIEDARVQIAEQLNHIAVYCQKLVFQLGFNWHGKNHYPLFENGTKAEMIDFIRQSVQSSWDIESVWVAERAENQQVTYQKLNDLNIQRNDSLGEFLNRPLFILHSKRFQR